MCVCVCVCVYICTSIHLCIHTLYIWNHLEISYWDIRGYNGQSYIGLPGAQVQPESQQCLSGHFCRGFRGV